MGQSPRKPEAKPWIKSTPRHLCPEELRFPSWPRRNTRKKARRNRRRNARRKARRNVSRHLVDTACGNPFVKAAASVLGLVCGDFTRGCHSRVTQQKLSSVKAAVLSGHTLLTFLPVCSGKEEDLLLHWVNSDSVKNNEGSRKQ